MVRKMGLRRKDYWLAFKACWETVDRESKCVILVVTSLNKHHQTAQCETAATMSSSPV